MSDLLGATSQHRPPVLRSLIYGLTCAVAFIAAGVPWYALRAYPVLRLGSANIHFLDILVATTVALGSVRIYRHRPRWTVLAWLSVLFTVYMLIPLAVGLSDPDNTFYAVREMRPFAYYLLGAVLVLEEFSWREHRGFVSALLAGTMFGVITAFVNACFSVPLPGYAGTAATGLHVGSRVYYLEWTVLPLAVVVAVAGMLPQERNLPRPVYVVALLGLVWYQLAAAARAAQILSLVGGLGLAAVLTPSSRRILAGTIAALVVTGIMSLGSAPRLAAGSSCMTLPFATTVLRWSAADSDRSLRVRIDEVVMGLQAFRKSPVVGLGLGSLLPVPQDADRSGKARNIASGFAFLLFKTGLLGLLVYLGLLAMTLKLAWHRARSLRNGSGPHALACVAISGVLILSVFNLVHKVSDIPEGAIALALLAGIATMRSS